MALLYIIDDLSPLTKVHAHLFFSVTCIYLLLSGFPSSYSFIYDLTNWNKYKKMTTLDHRHNVTNIINNNNFDFFLPGNIFSFYVHFFHQQQLTFGQVFSLDLSSFSIFFTYIYFSKLFLIFFTLIIRHWFTSFDQMNFFVFLVPVCLCLCLCVIFKAIDDVLR